MNTTTEKWVQTFLMASCLFYLTTVVHAQDKGSALKMSVSMLDDVTYTRTNIPLRITFENTSTATLRLLNKFAPHRVFFDLQLKTDGGMRAKSEGTKNISHTNLLPPSYIILRSKQKVVIVENFSDLMNNLLEDHNYTFALKYRNEWGTDCFKGKSASSPLTLRLKPASIDASGEAKRGGEVTPEQAVEIARKAIGTSIKLKPEILTTVEQSSDQLIVTFGSAPPIGIRGADFDAKVFINRKTGKVDKMVAGQ